MINQEIAKCVLAFCYYSKIPEIINLKREKVYVGSQFVGSS
jgi:hypothetical protein